MDDQHAVLMDTMNELSQSVACGGGREQVCEDLNRLIEFTRLHFSSEERLLEENEYPKVSEHRQAHQRLLVQIEEAANRVRHAQGVHIGSLLSFLHGWYMSHVEDLDQPYGEWLNERGIS
jgi:hemerythrin